MASVKLPANIPDELIEDAAESFIEKCGDSPVLRYKNRLMFNFEEYLALYLISPEACAIFPTNPSARHGRS